MVIQLTKKSSESEIKAYFTEVLKLAQSKEQFPVNLDDVWPLVYTEKGKAVRALKNCDLFIQGIDYQVLRTDAESTKEVFAQNGKNLGGRPTETYLLSLPCLEFFIARKVRPVFDVYREVFHKAASFMAQSSAVPSMPAMPRNVISEEADPSAIPNQHDTLLPLAMFYNHLHSRFCRVARQSCHNKSVMEVFDRFESQYQDIRMTVSNLSYIEEVMAIEGVVAFVEESDRKEVYV